MLLLTGRKKQAAVAAASGQYLQSLIGWWALDEASGDAIDSASGGLNLTANATPGTAVGKVATCRTLEAASSQYFNRTSGTNFGCANIAFFWSLWVKWVSQGDARRVFSHAKNDFSFINYELYESGNGGLVFRAWSAGLGGNKAVTYSGALSTGLWYHIVCGQDAPDGNLFIAVNNSTPDTAALAGLIPAAGDGQFNLGRYAAGENSYIDAYIDEVGFWKRAPLVGEIDFQYNAGAGRSYAQTAAV